mmetsp:Transcript_8037/g.17340  ORF Transcript_8037/g.17340 Transcript_8037/m.17340 type:complete len:234 (-) Transcript_8037:601-1302(-)
MGHLRGRVGDPGHHQVRHLHLPIEKGILNRMERHSPGHVGKEVSLGLAGNFVPRHITHGVDVGVGGLKQVTDLNPLAREFNPRLLQPDPVHVRLAPGGHQEHLRLQDLPLQVNPHSWKSVPSRGLVVNIGNLHPDLEGDPSLADGLEHHGRRFGVLSGEQLGHDLTDGHLRTQQGEGLSHLQSDRSPTHHHHSLGLGGQVEERAVGVVRHIPQAWDRGDHRCSSCRDHGLAEL